jgi:hypothetical protein
VPPEVEALLAEHGLKMAMVTRAHHEQAILNLVDLPTGMPVRRLPVALAEALGLLAARAQAQRGRR